MKKKKPHNNLLDTSIPLISYQCKFYSSIINPDFDKTKEKDIINDQKAIKYILYIYIYWLLF